MTGAPVPGVPARTDLTDQPTVAPTPKWVAGVSTGGATIVLLWAARTFAGLDVPPEVGEALVLAAGGLAGWLKRNRATLLDCLDGDEGGAHTDRDGDGLPG
jgi:hypothetical protein